MNTDMARPLWFVELIKKTFPNRRMIAKLTRVPIIGKIVDKMLFEGDDIIYLPKDGPFKKVISIRKSIDTSVEMALPSRIVEEFIERANHHWIMNFCICRDSSKCKDYPIELGCLFLGEAVHNINPKLGRLVTKEEALEHVKKCREAGLVHLIGRNKLDAMWLDAHPGNKLLSICNCCPCCCLWKVLPVIHPEIGRKVTKLPGLNVQVTDDCTGCGTCQEGVCFVDAIRIVNGRAIITKDCRGCGRCVEVCPEQAIEVTMDNERYFEESIERIGQVVDVR
jgi:Pyruvate/2-oxoacid:ferredoxin oxidoreductase delta subunit